MTKHNIGRKYIAALIDYSIIMVLEYYLIFTFGKPAPDKPGVYQITGIATLITIIPWMILIVCVEYFLGSTLGNGIVGLKPVAQENQNRKLTFIQSFQRHLLDPIDMFLFGLVGYLVMKSNQNGQRLGDIWAKTVVIKYNR